MRPDARAARTLFALALLVGLALRLYPQHRFQPGPELQIHFPRNAVQAIVEHDWKPYFPLNGSSFLFDLIRIAYSVWYLVGHLAGRFHDRLDFLVAFVRDPLPFVLVGRAIVIVLTMATIWLTGRVGRRAFGPLAGACAALVLAVTFVHVRESHHVWLDAPAGFTCMLATLVALRTLDDASLGWTLLLGAATGMAVASNHRVLPIVVVAPLAVLLAPGASVRGVAVRALLVVAGAAVTFAMISPWLLLATREMVAGAPIDPRRWLSGAIDLGLPVPTLLRIGIGIAPLSVAVLGLAAGLRRSPRAALVCAGFPVAYIALLCVISFRFIRYLAPLAPFVALFAGAGIAALGALLAPRRQALGVAVVACAVVAAPFAQSFGYDRLRGRTDTRILAGEWIMAHVPPGTVVSLPNIVYYPNPVLPADQTSLQFGWGPYVRQLKSRNVPDPARTWPSEFLAAADSHNEAWTPTRRFVVTVEHPAVKTGMNTATVHLERIKAAGGAVVARFDGIAEPLPAGVVFDPLCADYLPLTGFGAVERPGPNLTIWEIPTAATSR
jgi:hypothetical protein